MMSWTLLFFFQKYKEFERSVKVEEIDGLWLVKRLAEDMEEMFHKKAQAMQVPDLISVTLNRRRWSLCSSTIGGR